MHSALSDFAYVDVEVEAKKATAAVALLRAQVGKPYNLAGAAVQGCSFACAGRGVRRYHDYTKSSSWFCSELVAAGLSVCGLLGTRDPCCVPAQQIYDILCDSGYTVNQAESVYLLGGRTRHSLRSRCGGGAGGGRLCGDLLSAGEGGVDSDLCE
jgi:hypothetical protein